MMNSEIIMRKIGGFFMINPINQTPSGSVVNPVGKAKTNEQVKHNTDSNTNSNANNNANNNTGVKLELGSKREEKVTYSNTGNIDFKRIEELKRQSEIAFEPLRKMVEELLNSQGKSVKKAKGEATNDSIEITPEIRAKAQESIGEGGEFSAENVSDRLVEFAKVISGGDKSKLDEIRDAIKKGYGEAEKAFGGELPEISKKTLDMTMKKLDAWDSEE